MKNIQKDLQKARRTIAQEYFFKKMKTPWKQNIRHCRVAQDFCTVQVKPLENCFKPTVASRG